MPSDFHGILLTFRLRCAADHGHEAVLELLLHVRTPWQQGIMGKQTAEAGRFTQSMVNNGGLLVSVPKIAMIFNSMPPKNLRGS